MTQDQKKATKKWEVYKKHVDGKRETIGTIKTGDVSAASAWYEASQKFVSRPYYITGWSLHVKPMEVQP